MSESDMSAKVMMILKSLDGVRIENKVGPGTPDVNYVEGWIENKWKRKWPKNADTSPVLIEHFTPQQRTWLKRRRRKGGKCFVLLQVKREWLLFQGEVAAEFLGRATKPKLIEVAYKYWATGLNKQEFINAITTS